MISNRQTKILEDLCKNYVAQRIQELCEENYNSLNSTYSTRIALNIDAANFMKHMLDLKFNIDFIKLRLVEFGYDLKVRKDEFIGLKD